QQYGPRDPHAGVQGDFGRTKPASRKGARPIAARELPPRQTHPAEWCRGGTQVGTRGLPTARERRRGQAGADSNYKNVAERKMANPIAFQPTPIDPRIELQRRLEAAPLEHAESLLAAFDLLEEAHRHGLLDFLHGAVRSKDAVLGQLAEY